MKKLNITKEQFNRSRYFKNKYGRLEYVSESGKVFKTNKGKVLMFKESQPDSPAPDDNEKDESLYDKIVDKHARALWDAIWALREADEELMEKTGKPLIDEESFKDIHNLREDLYMELAPYLDSFIYSYEGH